MSKPSPKSSIYRLIEAGQRAHKALLVPLLERGLEPGDDAVLFALAANGMAETELAAELGLSVSALDARLARLAERQILTRTAGALEMPSIVALTERGMRIRDSLAESWGQLEEALLGDLKPKQRKRLGETLGRLVELLGP